MSILSSLGPWRACRANSLPLPLDASFDSPSSTSSIDRSNAHLNSVIVEDVSLEDVPQDLGREIRPMIETQACRSREEGNVSPVAAKSPLGQGATPPSKERPPRNVTSGNRLTVPSRSLFKSQVLRTPADKKSPVAITTPDTRTPSGGRMTSPKPRPASLIISRSLMEEEEEAPPEALLSVAGKMTGNQSICAPPSSIGFETGEGLSNQISEKCFTQDAQWKRAVEEVRRAVQKSVARGCAASPSELVADLLREGAAELYGFWSLSERSLMPMIDLIMGNSKTVPCREATMMREHSSAPDYVGGWSSAVMVSIV
ncbi:hypothetical protein FOZ60_001054 [Perkinsus olseni]|uniref:Uncharacterized protein n=1 Tax=Perkinsus olseni TaxID=32597 RepID=A0A7J6P164_PEROL|nr:hypothetical protein FOZ60_001054 [Perkinsus olseni]